MNLGYRLIDIKKQWYEVDSFQLACSLIANNVYFIGIRAAYFNKERTFVFQYSGNFEKLLKQIDTYQDKVSSIIAQRVKEYLSREIEIASLQSSSTITYSTRYIEDSV